MPAKRFSKGEGYVSGEDSEEDEEDSEQDDDDVEFTTVVVTSLTAGKVSQQTRSSAQGRFPATPSQRYPDFHLHLCNPYFSPSTDRAVYPQPHLC